MISKKELAFVTQSAQAVPFPGTSYAEMVIKLLSDSYDLFKSSYMNKEYNFILSNGEEFEFTILPQNLAHLLGVDYKAIISDDMQETSGIVLGYSSSDHKSAFDCLDRIIKNADKVIKNDSMSGSTKILNYYKLMIKCNAFSKISKFDEFNFGCINFNKKYYETKTSHTFNPSSTKFFFTEGNEAITPYFMMGIKQDEQGKYIPETIIAPEKFYNFVDSQSLVLPVQILVNDNSDLKKKTITNKERLQLLNLYKYILSNHKIKAKIDIFNDYENLLKEATLQLK